MDTILYQDFATNEAGWRYVLAYLDRAAADTQRDAANADTPAAHLDARGRMRGLEHAKTLIAKARDEMRRTKET